MNQRPRVFELEEANALLPEIDSLLRELEERQEAFQKLQEELFFEEILEDCAPPEEKLQVLETTLTAMETEIGKIRELGCLLRHPAKGLVDFLGRKEGKWVYYCWRRGEKTIQFYHTLRGGYLERHPLS